MDLLVGLIVGIAASVIGAALIAYATRRGALLRLFGLSFHLAIRLRQAGITRFQLHREDYPTRLPDYLTKAENTIEIVSISLKLTSDEGDISELFRKRLIERPGFRISISLLNPDCSATEIVAASLGRRPEALASEIRGMLIELTNLRDGLPAHARSRLRLLVHETLPMGSAIMLDSTESSGRIQVETKLYRAPRTESFGFEVIGPSPFYRRNYIAWSHVLNDARAVTPNDLVSESSAPSR